MNSNEINTNDLINSRFVIIRSHSQDDIHKAIKYGIWHDSHNQYLKNIYEQA